MTTHQSYNSLPHTSPQSNGFIKRQVTTLKTYLSTTQDAWKPIEDLLLDLQSTPIILKMPLHREILHTRMLQCPGKPSTSVDMEHIYTHLLPKKKSQKQYFDTAHNAKPITQLDSSQEVLLLSTADQSTYVPRIIVNKVSTLWSYHIEAQGKQYWRTWEHVSDQSSKTYLNTLYPNQNHKTPNPASLPNPP